MEFLSLRNSPWRVQVAWFISFTRACIIRGVHSFGHLCLNLLQISTLCVQSGTVALYVAYVVFCNVLKMWRAVFWACQTHHKSQMWFRGIFCASFLFQGSQADPSDGYCFLVSWSDSKTTHLTAKATSWHLALIPTHIGAASSNAEGTQTKYV